MEAEQRSNNATEELYRNNIPSASLVLPAAPLGKQHALPTDAVRDSGELQLRLCAALAGDGVVCWCFRSSPDSLSPSPQQRDGRDPSSFRARRSIRMQDVLG
eukprot:scaffold46021_cov16-Tisochrysis_lutea.AAC.1